MTAPRTLRDLLVDREWSVTEFGDRCGVTRVTASTWVNGKFAPRDHMLKRVAKVLGLSVDGLREVLAATRSARDS